MNSFFLANNIYEEENDKLQKVIGGNWCEKIYSEIEWSWIDNYVR